MQVLFWATAGVMVAAAIAAVFVPLRLHGQAAGVTGLLSYAAITVTAAGIYTVFGTPEAVGTPRDAPHATRYANKPVSNERASTVAPSIGSLLSGLEERLRQDPDDAGGWLLLAQSYQHLGRDDDARAAYEKARALGKSDTKLDATLGGESPEPAVRGRVTLSSAATAVVKPDDIVFVFARQSANERMPVAALRRRASELPFEFELSDRHAMIEGRRLSDLDEVIVSVSISRSGKAGDDSLQLDASSGPVPTDGSGRADLTVTRNARARETGDE